MMIVQHTSPITSINVNKYGKCYETEITIVTPDSPQSPIDAVLDSLLQMRLGIDLRDVMMHFRPEEFI